MTESKLYFSLRLVIVMVLLGLFSFSPILTRHADFLTFPVLSIFISSLMIVGIVAYVLKAREALIEDFLSISASNLTAFQNIVDKTVTDFRRPLITKGDEPESVSLMIANLIRESTKGSLVEIEGFNIIFLGAAGLQLGKTRSLIDYDIDDKKSDPALLYQGALEELSSKSASIARIVRMMSAEEFLGRGADVQDRYLLWLNNQRSQMQRNPNYQLINSPRAPEWGAPNASILLSEALATISNKQGVTYIIKDPYISRRIGKATFEEIYSGKNENISIYKKDGYSEITSAYHFFTVETLRDIIKELELERKGDQTR